MKGQRKRIMVTVMLALLVPACIFADLGPKPSVDIKFENRGEEDCWATLISETPTTGPARVWDGDPDHAYFEEGNEKIWKAFVEYEDADGYCFLQWLWDVSDSGEFTWGYYPPERFKVLLYYPESDQFRVSGVLERYAFDSYFTLDVREMEATRTYDWAGEMISLVLRIVITIGIELLIAYMFGFREKSQIHYLLVVNIVSQVMLNVALSLLNYSIGAWTFFWWYVVFEAGVFLLEGFVYACALPKYSTGDVPRWKCFVYSLIANLCSFGAGFAIFQLIPGIF